jgi:hypothetical protein
LKGLAWERRIKAGLPVEFVKEGLLKIDLHPMVNSRNNVALSLLLLVSCGLVLATSLGAQESGVQTWDRLQATAPLTRNLKVFLLSGTQDTGDSARPTSAPLLIQVNDQLDRPVAGAQVFFRFPLTGPSATFAGGKSSQVATTDGSGRATALNWARNEQAGKFDVHVTATYGSQIGEATFSLRNVSNDDTVPSTQVSPPTNVKLPVEVIGPDGLTVPVSFAIAEDANVGGPLTLSMEIHGLRYQTQASVQVNDSGWQPIDNNNVRLLGLANAYGGIGGGFHTLRMTMSLPAGIITKKTNTLSFRFNGTDGRVSGFRVLGFDIETRQGTSVIAHGTFVNDDPNTWKPPFTNARDVAAGQMLWRQAALTIPIKGGTQTIKAHCSDCHAQDGRDLKYFNYSNNSIRTRSLFHGLTAQQGDQIASYIRSLNVPNPGRPWNPPYQPGPGLDLQPVSNWSAGAGIKAVLDHDADMLPYLMPKGSAASWAASANLSAREIPIAMQLPDWNSWLPGVHPMDAWPTTFLASQLYANYQTIRAHLVANDPASYKAMAFNIWNWTQLDHFGYLPTVLRPQTDPAWKDPQYRNSIFSLEMWSMVKNWEINHEFGLEEMPQATFGPQADSRAWYSAEPFFVSPNMIHAPVGSVGNSAAASYAYESFIWYQLQLLLNASNNRGNGLGPSSDFPYVYNHLYHLSLEAAPQALLQTLWLIKGLQASQNGAGPQTGSNGWALSTNDPYRLVWGSPELWDANTSPADRLNVMQTYLTIWLKEINQFTPQQFYAGKWFKPTDTTDPNAPANGYSNSVAYMIPRLRYYGVSSTITDQIIAWAKTVWPNYNWDGLRNTTCLNGSPELSCTRWP